MSGKVPHITMVFTGPGAQWAEMGLNLFKSCPAFRVSMDAMEDVLKSLIYPPTWTIKSQLQTPPRTSRVHQAEIALPICAALQIALVDMLSSVGVEPDSVVGHSSGEIAAAYASGAISRTEAIIIAYYRGFILKNVHCDGTMATLALDVTDTSKFLRPGVDIACENGPQSTVISGDRRAVLDIVFDATGGYKNKIARKLNVEVAYHSHHLKHLGLSYLDLIREELGRHQEIIRKEPVIPMYSSAVTSGKILTAADLAPDYWVGNLLSPVKFHAAVKQSLLASGETILVEVGPASSLIEPLRQICTQQNVPFKYCSTLKCRGNELKDCSTALRTLVEHGVSLDATELFAEG